MIDRTQPNAVRDWLQSQITAKETAIAAARTRQAATTPLVNEKLFVAVIVVTIALLAIATGAIQYFAPTEVTVLGTWQNLRILLMAPIVVYVIAGFRVIDITEVAGGDFFGTPVYQFQRGLIWIPLGIIRLSRESATFVQAEFPGDSDKVQWTDEETALLPGKVRPLFVITAENPKGTLPTDKQMTIGMSFLAKIKLVRERFFDLVRNIAPVDPRTGAELLASNTGGQLVTPRMLEVLRHLRDTGSSFVNEIVAKVSYNELREHLELVNRLLMLRMEEALLRWGVDLEEASFTKINPSHSFNVKLQERANAISDRDATITKAEGEKRRLVLEGQGKAQAEKARLSATAAGFKKIMDDTGLAAKEVASTEVGKALATGPNNIIVTEGGVSGLIGSVIAGTKAAKNN